MLKALQTAILMHFQLCVYAGGNRLYYNGFKGMQVTAIGGKGTFASLFAKVFRKEKGILTVN